MCLRIPESQVSQLPPVEYISCYSIFTPIQPLKGQGGRLVVVKTWLVACAQKGSLTVKLNEFLRITLILWLNTTESGKWLWRQRRRRTWVYDATSIPEETWQIQHCPSFFGETQVNIPFYHSVFRCIAVQSLWLYCMHIWVNHIPGRLQEGG